MYHVHASSNVRRSTWCSSRANGSMASGARTAMESAWCTTNAMHAHTSGKSPHSIASCVTLSTLSGVRNRCRMSSDTTRSNLASHRYHRAHPQHEASKHAPRPGASSVPGQLQLSAQGQYLHQEGGFFGTGLSDTSGCHLAPSLSHTIHHTVAPVHACTRSSTASSSHTTRREAGTHAAQEVPCATPTSHSMSAGLMGSPMASTSLTCIQAPTQRLHCCGSSARPCEPGILSFSGSPPTSGRCARHC